MTIKDLPTDLYKSIAIPQFYREITTRSLGRTTKYFVFLCLIYALASSVILGFREAPKLREKVTKFSQQILMEYPDDLVITSKEGVVTVNRPEPFIVQMPKEFLENQEKELEQEAKYPQKIKNFVVLDKNGTVGDLERYETLFVVNSTNIVHQGPNGVEAQTTKGLPDSELTKEKVREEIENSSTLVNLIPLIIPAIMFILTFGGFFVFRFTYTLGMSLFIKLLVNGRGLSYSYKDCVKIGLHSLTFPTLLDLVFYSIGWYPPLTTWFFVVNVAFLLWVIRALGAIESKQNARI